MSNDYFAKTLPADLPVNPMHWANAWLEHALDAKATRNPNSMTLVTLDGDARPSARVVLCKGFAADPGYLVFYTNYASRKVRELSTNPNVAVVFHWDAVGRQVRIEGKAVKSPADESDRYFASRGWGSQLSAWGSDQSTPIESREALVEQLRRRADELGVALGDDITTLAGDSTPSIPRPPHWGGVRVWAESVELWLDGSDRVHDRARWTRNVEPAGEHDFNVGTWDGTRLQP